MTQTQPRGDSPRYPSKASDAGEVRSARAAAFASLITFALVLAAYLVLGFVAPPRESRSLSRPSVSPETLVHGAPIVYLGSSTARENTRRSGDMRDLAQLLATDLGLDESQVALIAVPGFQPLVYRAVVESFATLAQRPRLAIVPIEMRVFSVPWGGHPGLQHREIIAALQGTADSRVDRALAALHLTPRRELTDWFLFAPTRVASMGGPPVPIANRPSMAFGDYQRMLLADPPASPERLELQFRAHYLHPLEEDHPLLNALIDIERLGAELGVTIVYELGPLNYQDLVRYTGEDATQMNRNVGIVTEALRRNGARYIIDSLRLIPADEFSDQMWSCEHLTPTGRVRRARAVADFLRQHSLL